MEKRKGSLQTDNSKNSPEDSLDELHQIARSQIDRIDRHRSSWKWSIGIILAMTGFALFAIGLAARLEKDQAQAQVNQDDRASIETPFTDEFVLRQSTNQPELNAAEPDVTEQGIRSDILEVDSGDSQAQSVPGGTFGLLPGNQLYVPLVSNAPTTCFQGDEILFELVSGPQLAPPLGTIVKTASPPEAQANWIIRNIGGCQWQSLALYSIRNGLNRNPSLLRNGVLVDQEDALVISDPGDVLTVRVLFQGDNVESISDEWVLVVNGFELFSQPHLSLNVSKWVVVQRPTESAPRRDSSTTGDTTGVSNPDKTLNKPPPDDSSAPRSTPTPPQR